MGVITHEEDVPSVLPPAKLFKAFVLDGDNLIPKVASQAIASIEILEGNGGPGTIKKMTFAEGSQMKFVKNKIEAIDEENFYFSYSIIEGGALMDNIEKITYEIKYVAAPGGGSICKNVSKYFTKGDFQIKEEEIKSGKEKSMALFKGVEAYLIANPDLYC